MTIGIGPGCNTRIARLFHALWHGECIARDAAAWQARICSEPKARRFFALQAAQETLHATLFGAAVSVLAPRTSALETPTLSALDRYRKRLEDDLEAGRISSSVVGLQIVLEGLGALTLARMNLALSGHGARFAPCKRLLEHQEDTHHAFGCRWLERQRIESAPALAADAREYFELACDVIDSSEDMFGYGISTPESYRAQLRAALHAALTRGWR